MVFIESIIIKDIYSFQASKIIFTSKLNNIFGVNYAGKSNLLRTILIAFGTTSVEGNDLRSVLRIFNEK